MIGSSSQVSLVSSFDKKVGLEFQNNSNNDHAHAPYFKNTHIQNKSQARKSMKDDQVLDTQGSDQQQDNYPTVGKSIESNIFPVTNRNYFQSDENLKPIYANSPNGEQQQLFLKNEISADHLVYPQDNILEINRNERQQQQQPQQKIKSTLNMNDTFRSQNIVEFNNYQNNLSPDDSHVHMINPIEQQQQYNSNNQNQKSYPKIQSNSQINNSQRNNATPNSNLIAKENLSVKVNSNNNNLKQNNLPEQSYKQSQQQQTQEQINQSYPIGIPLNNKSIDRLTNSRNVYFSKLDTQELKDKSVFIDHSISIKELQKFYFFDGERGLMESQVIQNRNLISLANQLFSTKVKSQLESTWSLILNSLIEYYLCLILCAIIFFVSYGYYKDDPSQVLLGLLIVCIIIGMKRKSFQKYQTEKICKIMKEFIPLKCKIIREGKNQEILTQNIVVGDIIILEEGQLIPVDCRIFQINKNNSQSELKNNFIVDHQNILTEILPRKLSLNCNYPTNYLKSQNVALQGGRIVLGSGKGIALMSANESYCSSAINLMKQQLEILNQNNNPISQELTTFHKISSNISILLAVLFLLITHLAYDTSKLNGFIFAGSIFIAVIPQGLLTHINLTKKLRNFFNRISKDQCCFISQCSSKSGEISYQINHYEQSIEKLSCVSCICTNISSIVNKTNTSVNGLWIRGQEINSIQNIISAQLINLNNPTYQNLILGSVLCNESFFIDKPEQNNNEKQIDQDYFPYQTEGNCIDGALIRFCQQISDVNQIHSMYPRAQNEIGNSVIIPYNQNSKITIVVVQQHTEIGDFVLYVKGEPKKIWAMCSSIEIDGKSYAISNEIYNEYYNAVHEFQQKGEDIVAIAKLPLSRSQFSLSQQNVFFDLNNQLRIHLAELTLIGLISLTNPATHNIQQSFNLAKLNGTKIIIMTDKDTKTTYGILKNSGIISETNELKNQVAIDKSQQFTQEWESKIYQAKTIIVNGDRLDYYKSIKITSIDEKIKEWTAKELCIFSNITQSQKLEILNSLQKQGHRIAAISSDILDLQFLLRADVSVSSADSTPTLLKKIADVELLQTKYQSDIQSTLEAIEEGRSFIENTKKRFAISNTLKMAQIIPLLAFIILRIPLALSAMFMILISCLSNFISAMFVSQEEPDIDTIITPLKYTQAKPKQVIDKSNKIVTFKLFFYSFFFLGIIASAAGFCGFFTTMNYLGFPVRTIFGIFNMKGYNPNREKADAMGYDSDVVDNYLQTIQQHLDIPAHTVLKPTMPHWNSLFMSPYGECKDDIKHYHLTEEQIDWNDLETAKIDLRKFFVYCDESDQKWKNSLSWSYCDPTNYVNYSTLTNNSACYTSDALNYAQTAYLLGLVFFQMSNSFALKSLKHSFTQTAFNPLLVFSLLAQIIFCIIIVEIPGIQLIFRTRPLHFWQWGIPAVPFSIFVLLHEELRKYLTRTYRWFKRVATL